MNPPDLFTLAEASRILRIGRTTVYDLARRDLATDGGEGLFVVRIGGQLRVPRVALERLTGGPISWPGEGAGDPTERGGEPLDDALVPPVDALTFAGEAKSGPARRRRRVESVGQMQLGS